MDHRNSDSRSIDIELCDFDDLDDGDARGFDPLASGRDAVFIIRRGDAVRAYRNACPHQGASLPWRKNAYLNASRTRIVCGAHGAQFDIENGRCVLGPALGKSLDAVPVRLSPDGKVVVSFTKSLRD